MQKSNQWSKLALEGAVIVGSILLAFAIDAWWEKRSDRQLEQELLVNILESIEASNEGITATLERMDLDNKNLNNFYNSTDSQLASVPSNTLQQLIPGLARANTFNVSEGATALLQTLDLGLIRNIQVRRLIGLWRTNATELTQYNQEAEMAAQRISVAFGYHAVFQEAWINGFESLETTVNLTDVRNDQDLMASVAALRYSQFVQRIFLNQLQIRNEELRQSIIPLIE